MRGKVNQQVSPILATLWLIPAKSNTKHLSTEPHKHSVKTCTYRTPTTPKLAQLLNGALPGRTREKGGMFQCMHWTDPLFTGLEKLFIPPLFSPFCFIKAPFRLIWNCLWYPLLHHPTRWVLAGRGFRANEVGKISFCSLSWPVGRSRNPTYLAPPALCPLPESHLLIGYYSL